jgi:tryptophan halogenase
VSLGHRANLTFDDDAVTALTADLPGVRSEPAFTAPRSGRRTRAMVGNVVAIGAAAGEVPPLDAGPEHLIQGGVTRLIALFPRPGQTRAAAGEYNRLAAETIERLRDLAVLRHRLARRPGAVWDLARAAPTPEGLAYKIAQFESRGRVVMYDEETFDEAGWTAALVGHGVVPRRHDPLVERMPLDKTRMMLDRMATVLREAAAGMPPHG